MCSSRDNWTAQWLPRRFHLSLASSHGVGVKRSREHANRPVVATVGSRPALDADPAGAPRRPTMETEERGADSTTRTSSCPPPVPELPPFLVQAACAGPAALIHGLLSAAPTPPTPCPATKAGSTRSGRALRRRPPRGRHRRGLATVHTWAVVHLRALGECGAARVTGPDVDGSFRAPLRVVYDTEDSNRHHLALVSQFGGRWPRGATGHLRHVGRRPGGPPEPLPDGSHPATADLTPRAAVMRSLSGPRARRSPHGPGSGLRFGAKPLQADPHGPEERRSRTTPTDQPRLNSSGCRTQRRTASTGSTRT